MPQEIRVLQCFECEMFQVDIVKKSNKWQCKICNTKQSLRKEIFRGSGLDCRNKVQQLNKEKEERKAEHSNTLLELQEEFQNNPEIECTQKINKWDEYNETSEKHSVQLSYSSNCLREIAGNRKRNISSEEAPNASKKLSKWDDFL